MSVHSVFEARNNLSRLIEASQAGEDVVIAKRGRAVVRIVPVQDADVPTTGAAFAGWLAANPLPERLMRTPQELDAQIAELAEGWE